MQVLLRVHHGIFRRLEGHSPAELVKQVLDGSMAQWDVRQALQAERRRVLSGCVVMFSRAIPLGQDPRSHRLWQLAERFGAVCSKVGPGWG